MRVKTPKLVITFATNFDALAMEAAARKHDVPGRIVPVPSQIDAGCGLAWCAEAADCETVAQALSEYSLNYEGRYEVMMY